MLGLLQLYGVSKDAAETDKRLLERRLDLAISAAVLLDKNNLHQVRQAQWQLPGTPPLLCHWNGCHVHLACPPADLWVGRFSVKIRQHFEQLLSSPSLKCSACMRIKDA